MAGRGPAPKDPNTRQRRNADPVALRIIHAEPVPQPRLPVFYVDQIDEKTGEFVTKRFTWPKRTIEWWRMWAETPLSDEYTETDWSELLDTARLHAEFWRGNLKLAGELRLRVAKFGATPEDRARLRIQFAEAEEADGQRSPKLPSSRVRRGPVVREA